jgi:hypothetical protein
MISVTKLDGIKVNLRRDQIGTIIGDDERDREDFLKEGAGSGIYLMENFVPTGHLLQVRETSDEIAKWCRES